MLLPFKNHENIYYLLHIYPVSGTLLNATRVFSHFSHTMTLWNRCYYPHLKSLKTGSDFKKLKNHPTSRWGSPVSNLGLSLSLTALQVHSGPNLHYKNPTHSQDLNRHLCKEIYRWPICTWKDAQYPFFGYNKKDRQLQVLLKMWRNQNLYALLVGM